MLRVALIKALTVFPMGRVRGCVCAVGCCAAAQVDKDKGEIISLQGDQRKNVRDFLVDQEICRAERIVVHGFGV